MKKRRIYYIFGIVFLCIVLIWLLYASHGRQIVKSVYGGKSIAILNRLISGQESYAPEYYIRLADALFSYSFFSLIVFALSFTAFYFRSSQTLLDRLLLSSGVTALLLSIILTAQRIAAAPECCWNSGRLAWSLAPAYGYKLYYGYGTGPSLSTLYGPIAALAYLPAALCSSPTLAIQCASFLAASFYFLPIIGLYICGHTRKAGPLSNIICVSAFFCLITLSLAPLHVAFSVCPDTPALGLSAFACLILYYRKNNNSLPFLLSSIFSVLAVWTKQTFVPILLALPFYVLLADGARYFKRYVLFMLISGLAVSGIFLWLFEPQDLFFCMFTVPSRHGWVSPSRIISVLRSFLLLLKESLLLGTVLIILSAGYLRRFMHIANASERIKTLLGSAPWPMLFIVSVFMIPTSILGRSKLGGSANTLSPTIYFLAFSVTALLLDSISASTKYGISTSGKPKILLLLLLAGLSCFVIYGSRRNFVFLDGLSSNNERLAYEFTKRHPHKAYFPFSPVPGLLAEKRLYHFYGGLDDKEAAGFPASEKNFLAHIPADIEMVAFPKNYPTQAVLKYLPGFSKRICVDDLPGCAVYVRE